MDEDEFDFEPKRKGRTIEDILTRKLKEHGTTTSALQLVDTYREKLYDLELLLQSDHGPVDLLNAAKVLDDLQCSFRLDHGVAALEFERSAMADAIDESVHVLKGLNDFPFRDKIIENSEDRSKKIRTGKQP